LTAASVAPYANPLRQRADVGERLPPPYEDLVAWQDRRFEHRDVGRKLRHRQGGLRDVVGCNGWFVGGGGRAGVAALGRHVDEAGMQAPGGECRAP